MVKKAFGYASMIAVASVAAIGCTGGDPAQAQTSQATRNEVREALGDGLPQRFLIVDDEEMFRRFRHLVRMPVF